jgi:hypothetical protein
MWPNGLNAHVGDGLNGTELTLVLVPPVSERCATNRGASKSHTGAGKVSPASPVNGSYATTPERHSVTGTSGSSKTMVWTRPAVSTTSGFDVLNPPRMRHVATASPSGE